MGIVSAKASLKSFVAGITWTPPASAISTGFVTLQQTQFKHVETQQFGSEIDGDQMPYCRIHLPDGMHRLQTDAAPTSSLKRRDFQAHLFIYNQSYMRDSQAAGEYFDTIFDAVMKAFKDQMSPTDGNTTLIAWGLVQRWRIELPMKLDESLHWAGTIAIDCIEYINN